jgi:hypothetical protein
MSFEPKNSIFSSFPIFIDVIFSPVNELKSYFFTKTPLSLLHIRKSLSYEHDTIWFPSTNLSVTSMLTTGSYPIEFIIIRVLSLTSVARDKVFFRLVQMLKEIEHDSEASLVADENLRALLIFVTAN